MTEQDWIDLLLLDTSDLYDAGLHTNELFQLLEWLA